MEETIPKGEVKLSSKTVGKRRVIHTILIVTESQILKEWTEKELIKEILKTNALERLQNIWE
jgi:hypothetical protein